MKRYTLCLLLILTAGLIKAQDLIEKPVYLNINIDSITAGHILDQLEALIAQTVEGNLNMDYIAKEHAELTFSTLSNFQYYENNKPANASKDSRQLINFYPLGNGQYSLSLTYITKDQNNAPVLLYTLNLIAQLEKEKVRFSIPLAHHTRYWQKTTIGNVTYFHRGNLNKERARRFNSKHTLIANKLNQTPEKLNFYMCENRQEILKLHGYEYSIELNGDARNGYGVVPNGTIFSVMNNEDFSHDMFHYYSGKIHQRMDRNWITEEGIAYLWGNAYYTDQAGEMITHRRLVNELKTYLKLNPETDLLTLFTSNEKIFDHIAPEISVRSTISGIIAKEVEEQKGMEGIFKLINAGRQDRENKYFMVIEQLLGINRENFNQRVAQLIAEY